MTIDEIATKLGAKKYGNTYRSKCPAHNGDHYNLWFSQVGTKIYFECKKGCEYMAVRAAIGLGGASKIEGEVSNARDPIKEMKLRRRIMNCWESSTEIDIYSDTPAALYLRNTRKLLFPKDKVPSCLREVSGVKYYDEDFNEIGEFTCMVARLDISDGSIANLHRTYLTPDGHKAPVEKPKKLMASPFAGCTDGAGIRLFTPAEEDGRRVLGIAEGIETALAVNKLFGTPVWAAWSSSGIAKFMPPADITDLFIFADNDKSGLESSNKLSARMHKERVSLQTRVITPELKGQDWDNVYQAQIGNLKTFGAV